MKLLVTGSNGFVGRALTNALESHGHEVMRVVRTAETTGDIAIDAIETYAAWPALLSGVDVVIHLAARVHDINASIEQLELYRQTNTAATLTLAHEAQKAGVKRFIFISTLYRSRQITDEEGLSKLNAGTRASDIPYRESDTPTPDDAYGISKWEAERGLRTMMGGSMEIVILRPPLVYGPMVRANFLRFLKLAASGLPLPLRNIRNQRSMVYIGNLVDAIMRCAHHPAAKNQTYLVADSEALSVPDLLRSMAALMQQPVRLLPAPIWLLRLLGRVLGRTKDIERLTESLTVDTSKIRGELGWQPPFTVQQGLAETVRWYVETSR